MNVDQNTASGHFLQIPRDYANQWVMKLQKYLFLKKCNLSYKR